MKEKTEILDKIKKKDDNKLKLRGNWSPGIFLVRIVRKLDPQGTDIFKAEIYGCGEIVSPGL